MAFPRQWLSSDILRILTDANPSEELPLLCVLCLYVISSSRLGLRVGLDTAEKGEISYIYLEYNLGRPNRIVLPFILYFALKIEFEMQTLSFCGI